MRSHVTLGVATGVSCHKSSFQYRKRYEITCDVDQTALSKATSAFQYRKRYEITCDTCAISARMTTTTGFNTASGMRSHVTKASEKCGVPGKGFQYRKRYEITCD